MTHDRPHQIKGKVTSAAIVKRVDLTPEHFKIWLRCAEPFPFEPGQYCTVGVDGVERPYSIVSSPREPLLELFVELIPPPRRSPDAAAACAARSATRSRCGRAPKACSCCARSSAITSWSATVTGVAPFVSMLRYWLEGAADDRRMYVLEGASFRDEFGYDDELAALAERHAKCASCRRARGPTIRATRSGRGKSGACTRSSSDYVREWELAPAETCIYACGHPQMIEDLRGRYAGTGFAFEEERFWKPH